MIWEMGEVVITLYFNRFNRIALGYIAGKKIPRIYFSGFLPNHNIIDRIKASCNICQLDAEVAEAR